MCVFNAGIYVFIGVFTRFRMSDLLDITLIARQNFLRLWESVIGQSVVLVFLTLNEKSIYNCLHSVLNGFGVFFELWANQRATSVLRHLFEKQY